MEQEYRLSFVGAIENEIRDHEEGYHWTVVHHSTLPKTYRPIKEIWSFKSKRKPDGEILKHKSRLFTYGGM